MKKVSVSRDVSTVRSGPAPSSSVHPPRLSLSLRRCRCGAACGLHVITHTTPRHIGSLTTHSYTDDRLRRVFDTLLFSYSLNYRHAMRCDAEI
jgi:hypothetical protein